MIHATTATPMTLSQVLASTGAVLNSSFIGVQYVKRSCNTTERDTSEQPPVEEQPSLDGAPGEVNEPTIP